MNRGQLAPIYRGRTACPYIFSGSSTKLINMAKSLAMNNVYIEKTDVTPFISLTSDGENKIEGKAIPEDPIAFFKPLFYWAKSVAMPKLRLNINLEYFNTSVSKQLMDFFLALEANKAINEIIVHWNYEEGDEEIQESGEIYQELLERTTFHIVEYAEVF